MTVGISPTQLRELAQETAKRWPNSRLHKFDSGDLKITEDGRYIGYLDLTTGHLVAVDEHTQNTT